MKGKSIVQAAAILEKAGFEAYFVGGCVRDVLRGKTPADIDMTTDARPEIVRAVFEKNGCKTFATGLKHGTVTALVDGTPIEITTYRVDGDYEAHRRPRQVTFAAHIEDDLARRDFTVNAMAWSPMQGFCDPFGGLSDLKSGILRCVGEPRRRFSEDALRILRALRFSAQLSFSIEEATEKAMREQSGLLSCISGERIYSELCKMLAGRSARTALLRYPDVLGAAIPEILPMVGFAQNNPHHIYDVWEHSVAVLDGLNRLKMPAAMEKTGEEGTDKEEMGEHENSLRLAALFHDVGKPHCYSADENGIGHFYGHAARGVEITENILTRLKADNKTRVMVLNLIKYHDAVIESEKTAVKRWLSRKGEDLVRSLIWLKRADNLGQALELRYRQEEYRQIQVMIDEIIADEECFSLKHLALNGKDILELGIPSGPVVGAILRRLLEAVLAGEVRNEREALLHLAEVTAAMGITENKIIIESAGNEPAADLIRKSGLPFDFPCGGTGKCGKCKIRVKGAAEPCTEQEKRLLSAEERAAGVRLACFCRITGRAEIEWEQAENEVILDWAVQSSKQLAVQAAQSPSYTETQAAGADEQVGLACDIGTTTVAMWLVGLRTGAILSSVTEANCQRKYGADVISRVSACREQGVETLSKEIRTQIELMGAACLACVKAARPEKVVVTGNTVMLYLFEGIDPTPLAVSPFSLTTRFGGKSRQQVLGTPAYLPGCIGAFAGADLLCAVLASDMGRTAAETGKPCLLADVGTNGEMALVKPDGKILCCSAPAGPAFEGANISCGMNASRGAISALRRSSEAQPQSQTRAQLQSQPQIEIIGGGKAQGVCGSGLLDCIAFMRQTGAMDETGYLVGEKDYEIPGTEVRLTQMDVRQVQMAKAAVCAGIRTLLCRGETAPAEIGMFYLAGGFGSYVNMDSAAEIGLFPKELRGKARFIGNGALAGAALLLRDDTAGKQAAEIYRRAEELRLAADAYFTEQYIKEMEF